MTHRQRGWLGWGLSAAAGYLGYVPGDAGAPGAGQLPDPPSDADIQELYTALELDTPGSALPEEQAAASRAGYMAYQLQVRLRGCF